MDGMRGKYEPKKRKKKVKIAVRKFLGVWTREKAEEQEEEEETTTKEERSSARREREIDSASQVLL